VWPELKLLSEYVNKRFKHKHLPGAFPECGIMNRETDKNEIISNEDLDCTGLYCPTPIFETRKKIDSMQSGSILKIIVDDPAAETDIPSWAKATGNELLSTIKENDKITFYIKKK
jgi:tRNA 2-thiouridine synthesizing protein A